MIQRIFGFLRSLLSANAFAPWERNPSAIVIGPIEALGLERLDFMKNLSDVFHGLSLTAGTVDLLSR